MKTKIITLFLAFVASIGTLFASDIQVDGIWYDFDATNQTASVTYQGSFYTSYSNEYTGSVVIPASVTYNGVTYSVTSIGACAFYGCSSLTSITIPNSVTSIGNYAFYGCSSLTSIEIPNSVTSIGERAFYNCSSLTSVTIGNSVTTIGNYAFYNCSSLTSVVWNATNYADFSSSSDAPFYNICSQITSFVFGNEVEHIPAYLCYGMNNITSVTIGNSVTSIGELAFGGCSSLTSVTIEAVYPPTIQANVFYDTNNCPIFVPCNAINAYKTAWSDYATRIHGNCASSYTIQFVNWNDSVLQSTQVKEGQMPQYTGATPTRPNTNNYSYTFSGWSPQIVAVTADATYIAQFEAEEFTCEDIQTTWLQTGGSGLGGMTTDNSEVWTYNSQYGAVGKKQGGATGWLLTPVQDLRGMKSVTLSFSHTHKYATNYANEMTLWVCSDYKGSVSSSTWQQLTISPYANNDWTFVNVTINVPLDKVGKNTVFGFKYVSTSSNYATWEIKNLNLNAECGFAIDRTGPCGDNHQLTWTFDPETKKLVISGNGTLNSNYTFGLEAPTQTDSLIIAEGVTSIGNKAFTAMCSTITSLALPNTVTSIGDSAFAGLNNRRFNTLILPPTIINIGAHAFEGASYLHTIHFGSALEEIGAYAFYNCRSLTSVTIDAETPPTLGTNAFDNTNNCPLYIPCGTLESYQSAWSAYSSRIQYRPLEYIIEVNVNDPLTGIVTLPQTICDTPITAIPNYGYHFVQWSDGNTDNPRSIELTQDTTFTAEFTISRTGPCGDNHQLTWTFDPETKKLVISGNGTLNSNYTFGLEAPTQTDSLIIAEGVTSIGNKAFTTMCSTITSLALPNTVTSIGDSAFAGLNNRRFNTLILPPTIISIGAHAFDGASYLRTIHFGSALEEIGAYAFNGSVRVQEMTCLAETTPNVGTDGLTSINSLAKLYVPNDYLFEYQIDNNWSRFVLTPLGASETTVNEDEVIITANENTATITWPVNSNADTYTIEITKDGVVFCSLIFNASGQLTGIAFAPSRNGNARRASAATMTANGLQFTVTGLSSGTHYAYTLTVKDSSDDIVTSYAGEFTTTGALVPTDITPLQSGDDLQSTIILRRDKVYTVTGQEVK